jgi:isoleucyl-tRNA synthetase
MYEDVPDKFDSPSLEREILAYWKQEGIFEASLALSDKEHVFYDGPPFPTGSPHHGTIFVSILKDSLARFFTMNGYTVPRRWGWDCHGLPIENAVERQLGIENKADIEATYGVAHFNDACRKFVQNCNDAWETYINKIGRWVDYENAYRSLDTTYMESVLWVFKACYEKDLIYKDFRVTPYCYQCETALSISDTRESDSTRPRQDPEIVVRFRAHDSIEGDPTYYLAWTTTPWTLISNLALAVGEDYDYSAVRTSEGVYILADALRERYAALLGEDAPVVATFKGRDLIGKTYAPMFPYFADSADAGCFTILHGDFVTLEDGVGIVHMAPAFGEDDYWLCRRNGLPTRNPVDERGCFTDDISAFAGRNVHECNSDVIASIKKAGDLVDHRTMDHNYPHCWRCRTPLIYRAMDAWYFAVEKIKPQLIEQNAQINWIPAHVQEGRFGKWLTHARDWNISRSRFWGTPIPVWECNGSGCEERRVLGSLAEIAEAGGVQLKDLHKEHLDSVTFACACGGEFRRIPEVLDCWFESGAMPYGQCHYPFENKAWFESHFPADFIVEYPGQIRCWFYYMHVLSVALTGKPAYKNCLVHGTLLAEDGSKVSKSKQNFTDPMELIDRYGADALRIYLLNSPAAVMLDLNFKDAGVGDQIKTVLLPVWNAYSFFVTYANIDGYTGDPASTPEPTNTLDRWILAAFFSTANEVRDAFETYQLNRSLSPVAHFIDDLTKWYIRRSRTRFWASGMNADKRSAYDTLYYVLINLLRIVAPSAPFISERIYRSLTSENSVHLSPWPDIPPAFADEDLTTRIALGRSIASLGLALRQKNSLRVRQPLGLAEVALPRGMSPEILGDQVAVIQEEINVKRIAFLDDPSELATVRARPDPRILGPKFGKETQQIINAAKAGNVREEGDHVIVFSGDREWGLDRGDIEIGYVGRDGSDVISDEGILVRLDANVTPELLEEGIGNDLNRLVQTMRKDAGYHVSDRILLHIEGNLEERWRFHVAELALAELTDLDEKSADLSQSVTVDGRPFTVRIKKA